MSGTRVMAALALLFSILAFLMAGIVVLRTGPEGGGLQANLKSFVDESGKVFSDLRARISGKGGEKSAEGTSDSAEAASSTETASTAEAGNGTGATESGAETSSEKEGGLKLDQIRERVDEIGEKIKNNDLSAGDYIDRLKQELSGLKEFSSSKGSPLLDQIGTALSEARERLTKDSAEAARRLQELSDDLMRRSQEQTRRLRSGPDEPAAESEVSGDSSNSH